MVAIVSNCNLQIAVKYCNASFRHDIAFMAEVLDNDDYNNNDASFRLYNFYYYYIINGSYQTVTLLKENSIHCCNTVNTTK